MEKSTCGKIQYNQSKRRVYINVRGTVYETSELTLKRYPNTLLGNRNKRQIYWSHQNNEYVFDRNKSSFDGILFFYQSYGILSRPLDTELEEFVKECEYFLLPQAEINKMKLRNGGKTIDKIISIYDLRTYHATSTKLKIWNIFEHVDSSDVGRIVSYFSLLMLLLSIITHCLETMPELSWPSDEKTLIYEFWIKFYIAINTWFCLEFSIRFICSPNRFIFLRSVLNWIELLALLPYFVLLFKKLIHSSNALGSLKLLSVLRIFRAANCSRRMKTVAVLLRDEMDDLLLFLLVLIVFVFLGGALIFHIERHTENTKFTSIPQSLWWAIQSFLTIGYGDIVPVTTIGKLFSSLFITIGVAAISIPMFSFSTKCVYYYRATKYLPAKALAAQVTMIPNEIGRSDISAHAL